MYFRLVMSKEYSGLSLEEFLNELERNDENKVKASKKAEVEKLAQALLTREVLHKSDVEELIGDRPFEEKKILEETTVASDANDQFAPSETTIVKASDESEDVIENANATIQAADATDNNE